MIAGTTYSSISTLMTTPGRKIARITSVSTCMPRMNALESTDCPIGLDPRRVWGPVLRRHSDSINACVPLL